MKVAIISGELPATTFIERLVCGLVRSGISVVLIGKINNSKAPRNGAIWIGVSKKWGRIGALYFNMKYKFLVKTFRRNDSLKLAKLRLNLNPIMYALLWHKPDIVHVQWAKSLDQFMWVQHFGIKVILSLRGTHINLSPLAAPDLAAMYKRNFPNVNGFHGVSKVICNEALKYGADAGKCRVIYSGFNLSQFSNVFDKNRFDNLEKRTIKIISVGRSHWSKGYSFALDAMVLLKSKKIDYQYSIIGATGNEELEFQRHQLGLKETVNFLDKVPFKEVKKLIQQADILLLSSVEEGIANVVLEAMLLGTSVIATDCGGMAEVISDSKNGLLVPVRNPDAIADAVLKFKNENKEILNLRIENAYTKTAEQHSEAKMVNNMTALYNWVMTESESN